MWIRDLISSSQTSCYARMTFRGLADPFNQTDADQNWPSSESWWWVHLTVHFTIQWRSLTVNLPRIWTDEKQKVIRGRDKRRREEKRRAEKRRAEKTREEKRREEKRREEKRRAEKRREEKRREEKRRQEKRREEKRREEGRREKLESEERRNKRAKC